MLVTLRVLVDLHASGAHQHGNQLRPTLEVVGHHRHQQSTNGSKEAAQLLPQGIIDCHARIIGRRKRKEFPTHLRHHVSGEVDIINGLRLRRSVVVLRPGRNIHDASHIIDVEMGAEDSVFAKLDNDGSKRVQNLLLDIDSFSEVIILDPSFFKIKRSRKPSATRPKRQL